MAVEKNQIRLAIVDDHNLFRKGLIKLINLGDKENKYTILFEAEDGNEMKEKLDKTFLPDIILMDINMPEMDGYESVTWLKEHFPDVNILVISMFESEEAVIRMLRLGINGYLSKDIEVEDMHIALETISNKGLYYSNFVSGIMANVIHEGYGINNKSSAPELSDNEIMFLELSCTELTYEQIASKMFLSPKTIDGYRSALFTKFNVKNRVGLAMYAVRNGLVKL